MRELCQTHKLALAPDGRCVLCRRPAAPRFSVTPEQETLISRIFTGLLGACLLVALAALIYVSRLDPGYTGARYAPAPAVPRQHRNPPASTAAKPELATTASAPAQADPARTAHGKRAARAAATSTRNAQRAPQAQAQAKAAAKPAASAKPVAAHDVEVTMYATPWCDICDRARDFLRARDVTLIEYDIDRDPAAARRLAKLNPAQSVPTFVIAGQPYVGYSPWEIHDALRDAALEQYSARAALTPKH